MRLFLDIRIGRSIMRTTVKVSLTMLIVLGVIPISLAASETVSYTHLTLPTSDLV